MLALVLHLLHTWNRRSGEGGQEQGKEGRSRGRRCVVCTQDGAAEGHMKKGEKQEDQSPGNIVGM